MNEGKNESVGLAEVERRAYRLESELRLMEAKDAFATALQLDPSSRWAAEGRARVAIQLNEEGAAEHCARALAYYDADPRSADPNDRNGCHGAGKCRDTIDRGLPGASSSNVAAHELMAELRSQAGEGHRYIETYLGALSNFPACKPLLLSYWNTLTRAERLIEALDSMDANRSLFKGDREFALLEITIANRAGLIDRAGQLLEEIDRRPDAQLARGQHRLQTGRADEAARLLEEVTEAEPDNLAAWALMEVAWRLTQDRRHDWLVGEAGLVGCLDLPLSKADLDDIAAMLRTIHRTRSQPLGQSVRGGTQTLGRLFSAPNLKSFCWPMPWCRDRSVR